MKVSAQSIQSLTAPGAGGWARDKTCYVVACTSFPSRVHGLEDVREAQSRVLVLHFDDIEDTASPRAFTPALAQEIRAFVEDAVSLCGSDIHFVCACDGGVSRSVAVATVLMEHFGLRGGAAWELRSRRANKLVYRLLTAAFE